VLTHKKKIIILYLLFIHVSLGIAVTKTDILSRTQAKIDAVLGLKVTPPELSSLYHKMLEFHKRADKNIPDNSVLFIGDSLTQGLAVTAVSPLGVNFGIGKDTTVGVINRIPFYHCISRSKLVVITIGVNDLKRRGNNEIIDNFVKILNLIPEHIPVLVSAIFPVDEIASERDGFNTKVRKLNIGLSNLFENNNRVYFFNINSIMIDSSGNLLDKYHIDDGVHLNDSGYALWISKLRNKIANIKFSKNTTLKHKAE
jgi:lysophospholipase L1-like esterase